MNFYFLRGLGPVLALAMLATACGTAASGDVAGGPGMSDLAPSYDARPDAGAGDVEPAKKPGSGTPAGSGDGDGDGDRRSGPASSPATVGPEERSASPDGEGGKAREARQTPRAGAAKAVRVSDPVGDLSRSIEGAPASADIVAVTLRRSGSRVEVRTRFAAAVPTRQSGGKGMNVASFYDVDDNGIVDYEVWASLADDGWGTGHLDRREERASFGPGTKIEVRVEGDTLVTTFPLDRVGGADVFRWSAASEWGSFESMAASTSARDYAPDDGAVDYPG
jgi:hypothetical protein